MEYSAAGVKFLLWFIEIRETIRLLKSNDWNKVKEIVYRDNIYQQKSQDRVVSLQSYMKHVMFWQDSL